MSIESGASLGQYRVERLLGQGGMGRVYRAFDTRLERPVAIKLLQPTPDQQAGRRLLQEARTASALNHPNICTVHEVAEHGDNSFIVMEFISGRSLSDVVADGPPPHDVVLELARQIAVALAHAHERDIVHGDLKTANVLLSESGLVKVVDFGLAQRRASTESATLTHLTAGTPYAMAPEQLSGGRSDSRSDVWAFGVLLQELASGTRPFAGRSVPELMANILREVPAPMPATINPALRRIVERCLNRDPGRRYQRAGELVAALEGIGRDRETSASDAIAQSDWTVPLSPGLTAVAASQILLIGREEEWQLLQAAWRRAVSGRRQLAFVAGEPGIGKTRLVMEFARAIASDGQVLLGRCDQEALLPQQPFVEALEWYVRECPQYILDAHLADLDGAWELAQLAAPLSRRVGPIREPAESHPESRRYRLFEAVATLISGIASRRPLLLVLEDLHWADRPTLLLLRHLLRSSHEAPLCIIATYRENELSRTHPLTEMLAELRRDEGVTRIGLSGLEEGHVHHFIERWVGREPPAALTHLVAGNTEGNPFFISEVLRHLDETNQLASLGSADRSPSELGGLPEGVRDAIGRRLARLSDGCHRILGFAAVIGREFTLPVLQQVADLSEDQTIDLLDEALAARLVHAVPGTGERFTFTHALVRDTLYEELTPARRSRLHRRVAEVLAGVAAPAAQPHADLAHHYSRSASPDDAQKAIVHATAAAERSAAAFALEEAARFYQIALQALDRLPPDPSVKQQRLDLHFRRGRAFAEVGLWGPARTELEAALALVDPPDTTRRTELLLEVSKCAFWMLDSPAVRRYATEALALAESLGRDNLVADAMSWLAGVLNAEGDAPAAAEMDRQAMARVGGPKTFGLTRTVITLYHLGHIDEAIMRANQAIESARASQDPNFRVYALQHLGISLAGAGRYSEARSAFEEMREFGRRHGVLPMLARGIAMFGGIHIALGDYARGEELAREAGELARRISFPPPYVSAGIDLLMIFARSHDPGRADALIDEVGRSVVAASGWHGWLWRLRLNQARAELASERKDWQSAIAAASDCIRDSVERSRPKYVALGLITRASARKATDDRPGAIADATRAVEVAREVGDPAVLLKALHAQVDIEGSDALVNEARQCCDRILSNLDDGLRETFLRSDLAIPFAKS
jgi:tetratricopeptide (TPR) repeat protein/predicted Ser/Thr protein kinase